MKQRSWKNTYRYTFTLPIFFYKSNQSFFLGTCIYISRGAIGESRIGNSIGQITWFLQHIKSKENRRGGRRINCLKDNRREILIKALFGS